MRNYWKAMSRMSECEAGWACESLEEEHYLQAYHAPARALDDRPLSPFRGPFVLPATGVRRGGIVDRTSAIAHARSLKELAMLKLMGAIKNKAMWRSKVYDAAIVARWRQEVRDGEHFTTATLDYCFERLAWEASSTINSYDNRIQSTGVPGTWQADGLVDADTKAELQRGISALINESAASPDWHPGSNQQVLDMVHPSLYPLVVGATRVTQHPFALVDALDMFGAGDVCTTAVLQPNPAAVSSSSSSSSSTASVSTVTPPPHLPFLPYTTSERYLWLPTDAHVDAQTNRVTFGSYINNLHPTRHAALYPVLASILERFLPLFERVLTELKNPEPLLIRADACEWEERPSGWTTPTLASDDDRNDGEDRKMSAGEESAPDDEEDVRHRIFPRDPEPFRPRVLMPRHQVTLAGRTLQVIVKLAEIVLTPERPTYDGGVWHVEGMRSESIVASGIYYVASNNISESLLEFRQVVLEPDYQQYAWRDVHRVYGIVNEAEQNQELGAITTQAGRCIAFPNTLQHRVRPFHLVDPSVGGGRRTILVFFLVDPAQRVVSTSHVPPQQTDWLDKKRLVSAPFGYRALLDATPLIPDLVDLVCAYIGHGSLLSCADAHEHRRHLMAERKTFVAQNSAVVFERPFSLCEH